MVLAPGDKIEKKEKRREDLCYFDLSRDGLHRQLGGGLPKGTITLITGAVGTGKSVVVQRFIYGFLKHGYTVTLISTELTTKGFIDQMNSLDYKIRDYILSRELRVIPVFPLIGEAKSRDDFLGRVMKSSSLYDTDIIVFDTFSALVKNDIDEERAFKVLSFFKKLTGKGKTFILTMDSDELSESVITPFKSTSDLFLELRTEIIENNVEHLMYITRFTYAPGYVGNIVGFRIQPGAGFIVDITMVA
jgi:flagellar protein FlaH